MTYRDITFCVADCSNTSCFRHYETNTKDCPTWMPISVSDFSKACKDYKPNVKES